MSFNYVHSNVDYPSNINELVELGKEQYISLKEKTTVLKYGECWRDAISNLHQGCNVLTEDKQSEMALRFTNCFLKMSTHETTDCYKFEGERKKECTHNLSDRAFTVYTEFYTHTQNICFYLKSQIWHDETEDTINRLSYASDKAADQLEELVDSSVNLKQALVDSQSNLKVMVAEFQIAASEQQRMLFDVFDRLSSLQEWAVGEISWLDTVVFYLCGVILSQVLTATPRTQSARFFLFVAFTVNVIAERYLCQYFINNGTLKIDNLNENLSWWVWLCRKILIIVCVIILSIAVIQYQDYNVINHNLLVQIQEQNMKLLCYLEKVKMLEGSVTTNIPSETRVNVDSDCQVVGENSPLKHEPESQIITPSKLPHSPRTTVSVLRKTEQVIQSALQSSLDHIDIVHMPNRSGSPAPSYNSTQSSSSSQRRRRKLDFNTEGGRTRYNLRHSKLEEWE
ncbi:hypothetical protein R5R35_000071 [Gryllus longicercus]|uniref:Uncharacterized protein n=1 Tax=Gryllus longicercus TaxID=2509291 RepID=A0AAN9V6Y6_9ORTH